MSESPLQVETKIVDQVQSGKGHISRWQASNGLYVYSQGVTSGNGYPSGSENISELDVEKIAKQVEAGTIDPKIVKQQQKLESKFEALSSK